VRTVMLVAVLLSASAAVSGQQSKSWPIDTVGTGGFSAKRLDAAPAIDGVQWVEADVKVAGSDAWQPAKSDYTLRFTDRDEESDVQRWALMFERPGTRAISLTDAGKTGFAYVTPDARFIFMEPLIVVDVRRWRRYALYSELGIEPYVAIRAISRDGRRLLVSHSECAYDCPNQPVTYFEVTLPS
jgi:hypothetical protein